MNTKLKEQIRLSEPSYILSEPVPNFVEAAALTPRDQPSRFSLVAVKCTLLYGVLQ